ncbi:kinase-like domain-containing protein [Rhizophagus clarus]|uniref:Kinase-like domain-containing protein n=1 Tax=Rhizophagus clarus TaxID=94130 RepID=A0A8H3MDB1_9GLOM|nr:kinase-like domain-containing protein [Rhizophagus clarus]
MDQLNNNPEPNITKEIDSMTISSIQSNPSIEKDFNIIVEEINDFIYKLINKEESNNLVKQKVDEYFNVHNINTQEIYNWLVNNQISTSSIFLLGCFNYYGIITSENNERAFNLFINASEKNHALAQFFVGNCYCYGYGTIKNEKLAFEYYEKAANKNFSNGQLKIGYCYDNGIGVEKDFKKAFYWYEKAANNGSMTAIFNLGNYYEKGIGTEKDYNKAFELYKQSAEGGVFYGIVMLGERIKESQFDNFPADNLGFRRQSVKCLSYSRTARVTQQVRSCVLHNCYESETNKWTVNIKHATSKTSKWQRKIFHPE